MKEDIENLVDKMIKLGFDIKEVFTHLIVDDTPKGIVKQLKVIIKKVEIRD